MRTRKEIETSIIKLNNTLRGSYGCKEIYNVEGLKGEIRALEWVLRND